MKNILLLTVCLTASSALAQTICTNMNLPGTYSSYSVNPHQTHPAISAPNNPHRAYINTNVAPLNQLVVFFPGTGGVPASFDNFCQNAANLGFHALALTYPNAISLQDFCGNDADPDCHEKVRVEVLTGQNTSTKTNINRPNSIEFRLAALLNYLNTNNPAGGWGQFLVATNVAWTNALAWNKFLVCGHSQGAGYAGLIAKYYEVQRVAMFAGGDYWHLGQQPATWNFLPSATPLERWFGYTHYFDAGAAAMHRWEVLGQTQFAPPVDVSLNSAPYDYSHTFVSTLEPCTNTFGNIDYHGATVNDPPQVRDTNGIPLNAVVWTHMLTGPTLAPPISGLVADSVADFSSVQGSNNWHYGFWDVTADTNGTFEIADFQPLSTFSNTLYAIPAWVLSNDVQVAVWLTGARPHGANTNACCTNNPSGPELRPVRRWISPVSSPATISGNLAKWDFDGGDGIVGELKVDGATVWSAYVDSTNIFGTNYSVEASLTVGSTIDLMISPGFNADDDGARFTAQIVTNLVPIDCSAPPELFVQPLTNGQFEISWQACTNLAYQIEGTTNLLTWKAMSSPLAAPPANGWMAFTVSAPSNSFFRLAVLTLTNSPVPSAPGVYSLHMEHGGIPRHYRLNISTSYTDTAAAPLVLALHGHNQTAAEFAGNQPGLAQMANSLGVILVIPDGTLYERGTGWNTYDPTPSRPVDDVAFLLALIDRLDETLNIDRKRLYAGGFSNGGQMCHALGSKTTNVFAALAAVGSAIAGHSEDGVLQYQPPPSQPMPVLIVNATNDCKRPFWGGLNEDGSLQPAAFESVTHWTNGNLCTPAPVITTNVVVTNHVRRVFADSCAGPYPPFNAMVTNLVIREHYQLTCTPGTEVLFVTLTDGGHKWPEADDNVGFDCSREALQFFLRHCRCDPLESAVTPIPTTPGRHDLKLCDQGYSRFFRLQIPAGYNPAVATPLVFALHGGGQTVDSFSNEHPALFNKCNFEGVILVLPEALNHPISRDTLWANKPFDYVVDDRFFITNLVAHLEASLNIDPRRIYACGFSGGGSFSHYLAGTTTGLLAAIAPVCTMTGWNDPVTGALVVPPSPLEPMPVMMVRGKADTKRPFNGGLNIDGVLCFSAADDIAYWTAGNTCVGAPLITTAGLVTTHRYAACAGTTEVIMVGVNTMPHLWPDIADGFGYDANVNVIDFLLMHMRP